MDMGKTYQWHKIAESIEELNWQQNNMCLITIAGKTVTLAKHDSGFFGFAHKCPHAGGVLADGFMDALGNVVCPLHRYKFNMTNGRNTSGEGYFMKTYPIEQREDGFYIGIEEKGLFSFL